MSIPLAIPDVESSALFSRMAQEAWARDKLIELYLPVAHYLARRFGGRGEPIEDLIQVASMGLIRAVDRFDPARGFKFSTFLVPTIVGELKRHLRDKGWMIRVPRSLQEAVLRIRQSVDACQQSLGRSPTIRDIAEHAGLSEEEVLEALEAGHAYSPDSLDPADSGGEHSPSEALGAEDATFELLDRWTTVAPAIRTLPERERLILYYRFVRELTQSEIAALIGISQMHVSRLLAKSLVTIRESLHDQQVAAAQVRRIGGRLRASRRSPERVEPSDRLGRSSAAAPRRPKPEPDGSADVPDPSETQEPSGLRSA